MVSRGLVWSPVNRRLRTPMLQMLRRSLRTMPVGRQRRVRLRLQLPQRLRWANLRTGRLLLLATLRLAPAQLLVRQPVRRLPHQALPLPAARRMLQLRMHRPPALKRQMSRLPLHQLRVHQRGLQVRRPHLRRKSRERSRLMRLRRQTQTPVGREMRRHRNRAQPSSRPERSIR
jgi:hypothetical protein